MSTTTFSQESALRVLGVRTLPGSAVTTLWDPRTALRYEARTPLQSVPPISDADQQRLDSYIYTLIDVAMGGTDPTDLGEVRTEYRLAWQRHDMTVCDGDSSISDPEVSEWRSSRPAVPVNSEIVYVIESRQVLTSTDPVYGLMRETEVGISDAGHSALGFGGGVAEVPAQSCEAADLLR